MSIQANTYDSSSVFQINSDYLDGLLDGLDKSFEFDLLSCAGAGLSRIFRDPTTNWTEREKGFNFTQKALLTW